MAMELTKCVFYHMPKTGGGWINEVLKKCCHVVKYEPGHQIEVEYPKKGKLAFSSVRHPVTWYESSYHYERNTHNCDLPRRNWIFSLSASLSFDEFVEHIVSRYPGWLSDFADKVYKDIDFIGHQENLKNDLIHILDMIKEPCDKSLIDTVPDVNVGGYKSLITDYTKKLIEKSESKLIERFY